MATHILVNPDVITSTTFEKAFLDVSGEPISADVTFTVYAAGAAGAQVATIPMNAQNARPVRAVGEEDRARHREDDRPEHTVDGGASPAARSHQGGAVHPIVQHHAGTGIQPAAR